MAGNRWAAILAAAVLLLGGEVIAEAVWAGTRDAGDEVTGTFGEDCEAPAVGGFSFKKEDGMEMVVIPENEEETYRYFLDQDTIVLAEFSDPEPSSGLERADWELYWSETGTWQTVSQPLEGKRCGRSSLRIPAGFKGWIQVKVADRAGNCSGSPASLAGLVLESNSFHLMEEHLSIERPETECRDADGWDLYREKVPLRLEVKDHHSGIRKVEWQLRSSRGLIEEETGVLEIRPDGSLDGEGCGEWVSRKSDRNLVVELERLWTVDCDANEVVFWVRFTDWAGNHSEREECFSMDQSGPELAVIPLETEVTLGDTGYLESPWKAELVVRDRNQEPGKITVDIMRDGVKEELPEESAAGGWKLRECQEEPGMTEYRKMLAVSEDGEYTVTVRAEDLAGRRAQDICVQFTIDTVPPEIWLEWEDEEEKEYYDHVRKAYVEVRERNFSAAHISMAGRFISEGKEESLPDFQEWEHDGEIHRTSFFCREDGFYEISVEGKDRAGNCGNRQKMTSFVIDTRAPELEIGMADGDRPVVSFADKHLVRESLELKLTGHVNGDQEIRGNSVSLKEGERFIFEEFPEDRKFDDCYTVSARVEDRAGNHAESSLCFAVNRYGSIYIPAAASGKIIGTYQSEAPAVTVTEKNPEELLEDRIQIRVIRNGAGRILTADEDYQMIRRGGERTWREYLYVIHPEVFQQEGVYQVQLTSVDASGHFNDSSRYLEPDVLSFGVDRTPPLIEALNLSGGMPYFESSMDAVFQISDNLLLERVEFRLNGQPAEGVLKDGKYLVHLKEADRAQQLVVKATDASGNTEEVKIDNFVITRNPLLYWVSFRTLFAGSLVLAAMVLWMVWKKKRNT